MDGHITFKLDCRHGSYSDPDSGHVVSHGQADIEISNPGGGNVWKLDLVKEIGIGSRFIMDGLSLDQLKALGRVLAGLE